MCDITAGVGSVTGTRTGEGHEHLRFCFTAVSLVSVSYDNASTSVRGTALGVLRYQESHNEIDSGLGTPWL